MMGGDDDDDDEEPVAGSMALGGVMRRYRWLGVGTGSQLHPLDSQSPIYNGDCGLWPVSSLLAPLIFRSFDTQADLP